MLRARYKGSCLGYFKVGNNGGRVSLTYQNWSNESVAGTASITEAEFFILELQRAVDRARQAAAVCSQCVMQGGRRAGKKFCVSRCRRECGCNR